MPKAKTITPANRASYRTILTGLTKSASVTREQVGIISRRMPKAHAATLRGIVGLQAWMANPNNLALCCGTGTTGGKVKTAGAGQTS